MQLKVSAQSQVNLEYNRFKFSSLKVLNAPYKRVEVLIRMRTKSDNVD